MVAKTFKTRQECVDYLEKCIKVCKSVENSNSSVYAEFKQSENRKKEALMIDSQLAKKKAELKELYAKVTALGSDIAELTKKRSKIVIVPEGKVVASLSNVFKTLGFSGAKTFKG